MHHKFVEYQVLWGKHYENTNPVTRKTRSIVRVWNPNVSKILRNPLTWQCNSRFHSSLSLPRSTRPAFGEHTSLWRNRVSITGKHSRLYFTFPLSFWRHCFVSSSAALSSRPHAALHNHRILSLSRALIGGWSVALRQGFRSRRKSQTVAHHNNTISEIKARQKKPKSARWNIAIGYAETNLRQRILNFKWGYGTEKECGENCLMIWLMYAFGCKRS